MVLLIKYRMVIFKKYDDYNEINGDLDCYMLIPCFDHGLRVKL